MQSPLARTVFALAAAANLIACGSNANQSAGGDSTTEKIIASLAGVSGQPAGPVNIAGGTYELRWKCNQPVSESTLRIALYHPDPNGGPPVIATTLNAPVTGDGSSGTYSTTLTEGVYLLYPMTPGTWNITVVQRQTGR